MLGFVVYLLTCHRQSWAFYRRTLFLSTFVGLGVQYAMSTAPPRFIGIPNLVDTANLSGMSIYQAAGKVVDQYSSFPSLHVAWAMIVAVVSMKVVKSWVKYLWFAHLPATIFVVVVTGNHYILDCVAGCILVWFAARISRISRFPIS